MSERLSVVIVDDCEQTLQLLSHHLSQDYQLSLFSDPEKALAFFDKKPDPDLIILDVDMPVINGYQMIREIKQRQKLDSIPILMLTSLKTVKDEVTALETGANDFMPKPVNPVVLKARVHNLAQLGAEQRKHKALIAELKQTASIDSLTQLNNRISFLQAATVEIKRCLRHDRPLAVLMIDIDYFKSINDTYGHDAGDKVLVSVADEIKATVREVDIVGRLGGEEFAIVLPETNEDEAKHIAERLRQAVNSTKYKVNKVVEINCTISIGGSMLQDEDQTIQDILRIADHHLYEAKGAGRNTVFFSERLSYKL